MKTERRASLEKPNVPVEIVGANRRPKSGREESVASIFREDRGSGGGMCAKDRGVNTGDPTQCLGASQSNRRSVRIGAGLSWESERSIVALKRVMIVERRDLSSRATLEVTRGQRLAPRPSNLVKPRQIQTTFHGLSEGEGWFRRVQERRAPCPKAGCETRKSGLMSGIWKRGHGQTFRHRQPKGPETVRAEPTSTAPDLDSTPSRHQFEARVRQQMNSDAGSVS